MQKVALVCLAVATMVGSAAAQNDRRWGFVRASANDVRLFYGLPDSDVITFSLICQPTRRRLLIVDLVLPPSVKHRQKATVALSAGTSSAAYDGKIVRDRVHGGMYFEAPAPADARIFNLLKAGPSLTIALGTANETLSLKGAAEPLAQMERTCLGNG